MIQGKTEKGFEYLISDEAVDDFELLEDLAKISDGDPSSTVKAMARLLGEDQLKKMKDFYRSESGRVKASDLMGAFKEIMQASKEGKNS